MSTPIPNPPNPPVVDLIVGSRCDGMGLVNPLGDYVLVAIVAKDGPRQVVKVSALAAMLLAAELRGALA